MRTRVYVDGFNLYYGALKGTAFKWLDPVLLTSLLLPPEYEIERLGYFTARVSGKLDPRAPARQRVYLKALATLAEVEIHYGRFLAKTAWRPLSNCRLLGGGLTRRSRLHCPEAITGSSANGPRRCRWASIRTVAAGVTARPVAPGDRSRTR